MQDQRPSKKQHELLQYIEGFIKGNGYGPSYREIMRALDYKSVSTVAVHVDGLIARGLLLKRDRSARSLEVVSGASGKAVDKIEDNSAHITWLTNALQAKIDSYKTMPSPKLLKQIATLADAFLALDLPDEYARAQARIAKSIKQ